MLKDILFGKWDRHAIEPLRMRLFYRLKALICAALGLEPPSNWRPWDYTEVIITYSDGGKGWSEYGTVYWCEYLAVGRGIFRNWWTTYFQDSSQ